MVVNEFIDIENVKRIQSLIIGKILWHEDFSGVYTEQMCSANNSVEVSDIEDFLSLVIRLHIRSVDRPLYTTSQ
jgi:hypothetical protein